MDPMSNNSQDSFLDSSFFGSTPTGSTPLARNVRKRKLDFCEYQATSTKWSDLSVISPLTALSSVTSNESLSRRFSHCHIQSNCYYNENTGRIKHHKTPSTPEKQIKPREETLRKPSSYVKAYPEESPLKDFRNILYPSIKPLEPFKQFSSPYKQDENLDKYCSPAKKCLFSPPIEGSLRNVITNTVVMHNIFKCLSPGDLYRFSKVTRSFKDAILKDNDASTRYYDYMDMYRINKENYRITPPNSPEKVDESPPSPNSQNYRLFVDIGKTLNKTQYLLKCPICDRPSVIDNNIGQCISKHCGYIFCKNCRSFAYSPEEFNDSCNGSILLHRSTFTDLSNTTDFKESGFYSGSDSSYAYSRSPVVEKTFGRPNNRVIQSKKKPVKIRSRIVPVMKQTEGKKIEYIEPPSPPREKMYAIGSKQSKKNLKRLTL